MRLLFASLVMLAAATAAHAEPQQQCEALAKPINAKIEAVSEAGDNPTPQACAKLKDAISAYTPYKAQADKMGCPFAYAGPGQKIGGAAQRAELLADMQKVHREKCK
jgi:hypothetical protein